MTREAFEAALQRDGFAETLVRDFPAGYYMGDHAHPFHARALVLSGDITLTVGGQATRYDTGMVFDLPLGCVHDERAGAQGVRYLVGRRSH
ncbi:MAG: cupin [Betaproteobacteria bacterium]|nr:cupin [Betaproteobacteria bacterium]